MWKVAFAVFCALVGLLSLGCTDPAPTPEPAVLAIAYVSGDGVPGFQESPESQQLRDSLVAKLIDTNRDGAVSAGDQVLTHSYPKSALWHGAVNSVASFGETTHQVDSVDLATSEIVTVNGPDNSYFTFSDRPLSPIWLSTAFESYTEGYEGSEAPGVSIIDGIGGFNPRDSVVVDPCCAPSKPEVAVRSTGLGGGDHTFIEIDILT